MELSNSQQTSLKVCDIFVCLFSLCGSLVVILCYFRIKIARNYAYKLVVFLVLSDAVYAISRLIHFSRLSEPSADPSKLCVTQAAILNFAGSCSVYWALVIAWGVVQSVIYQNERLEQYEYYFVAGSILVPGAMTAVPLITGDYGNSGVFCWIRNQDADNQRQMTLHLALYIVPVSLVIVYNFLTYIRVIQQMKSMAANLEKRSYGRLFRKLMRYPIVLLLCNVWSIIYRITIYAGQGHYWLMVLATIFSGLQGFCNMIAYGMNKSVRSELKDTIATYCRCQNGMSEPQPNKQNQKVSMVGVELHNHLMPNGAES